MLAPNRIVGLLEVLKKFEGRHVIGSLTYIAQTERLLQNAIVAILRDPGVTYSLTQHELDQIPKTLMNLPKAGEDYGIPGVASAAGEALNAFSPSKLDRRSTSIRFLPFARCLMLSAPPS